LDKEVISTERRANVSVTDIKASPGPWHRVLIILLVVAIAGTVGTLGYVMTTSKVGERFTQFYILGPEGKAEDYPRQIVLGQSASVILGIANHERQPTSYRVEIMIDGEKVGTLGPIVLAQEEEWKKKISLTPTKIAPRQKVEFWLYKGQEEEVWLKTHLWVDVNAEG